MQTACIHAAMRLLVLAYVVVHGRHTMPLAEVGAECPSDSVSANRKLHVVRSGDQNCVSGCGRFPLDWCFCVD